MTSQGGFPMLESRHVLGEPGRSVLITTWRGAASRYGEDTSEAAKKLVEAERQLNLARPEEAITAAEVALEAFRAKGDAGATADCLQVLSAALQLKACQSSDEEERKRSPEGMLMEALEKTPSDERRAQAVLQLSLCELLACGTAEQGWCLSRSRRDRALQAGQEAVELFQNLGDTLMVARAKIEVAFLFCQGSAPKVAFQEASDALELLRRLGDKQLMGLALHAVAASHAMAPDYQQACKKGQEALAFLREAGDKRAQVLLLETLARWSLKQAKPQHALVVAKEALAMRCELGCTALEELRSSFLLIEALAGIKKVRRGLKVAEDCFARLKQAGDHGHAVGLLVMAYAQLHRGHPELALTAGDEAVDMARELGDMRLELSLQHLNAEINVELQSKQDALESAEEAAIIAQKLGDAKEEADAECLLTSILLRSTMDRQSLIRALKSATAARELYKKAGHKRGEAIALIRQASVLSVDVGSADEMLKAATEAHDISEEEQCFVSQSAALQLIAEAHLLKESWEEAREAAKERRALWKSLVNRNEEGDTVIQMVRIHLAAGDFEAAEKHGLEAQKVFQECGDKAAESVACVHLVQACLKLMMAEASGETKEALSSQSYRAAAEKAMRAANDAITACRHLGSKQLRAGALFWRAQVLGFRGRLEEALHAVIDAERCFESIGADGAMVQCKVLAADCLAGLKSYDEAKEVAKQAVEQAGHCKDRQAQSQAKDCLERVEQVEKKSKEIPAAPVQQAIAAPVQGEQAPVKPVAEVAASAAVPEQKGLDPALATKRVMAIVSDVIAADDDLSADSPLMEAGMDSLSSVQLVTEVSKEFQMSLSPSLVFDFPTVAAVVAHLVEESNS
eukprot:TRINITY_DN49403_c0_g1_i1.p1 TRINITY_DN49403_c0_g1~~TRINITY_DN49403_c0_g1_i1.p1  ORF type:complete len:859 (+),score=258.79 TRINITY_DN49403_c0_g1_i1:93-2669(+)